MKIAKSIIVASAVLFSCTASSGEQVKAICGHPPMFDTESYRDCSNRVGSAVKPEVIDVLVNGRLEGFYVFEIAGKTCIARSVYRKGYREVAVAESLSCF